MLLLIVFILLAAGLIMLKHSVNTMKAYKAFLILIGVTSTLMAFNVISFGVGIFATVIISLFIIALDETGILA